MAPGGTLKLAFAEGVDVASQVGRTIDLFDWTGVTPTGAFTVESPYTWNLSNLYITGEVTLLASSTVPGDFDGDGDVDGRDFLAWQRNTSVGDLADWQANYGVSGLAVPVSDSTTRSVVQRAVPEPGSVVMVGMAVVCCGAKSARLRCAPPRG